MSSLRFAIVVCGVAALSGAASADFIFGSGRSYGMARAGLAVPYDFEYSAQLNPAMYGLGKGDLRLTIPKVGLRLQGLDYGDLKDVFSSLGNGGASSSSVQKLSRIVGGKDTEFGLDSSFSAAFGGAAIDVSANGTGIGRPNAALATFINNGGDINTIPNNANQYRFDGYGVADYDVAVAYGRRLKVGTGDDGLSIGARAHFIRTYYSHYKVDTGSALNNPNGSAVPGEDMGGDTVKSQSGFGLDLGGIFSTGKDQGVFVGGVVENLITPNISFDTSSPGVAAINGDLRPFSRRLNLGAGYMTKQNFVIATDLYDVFGGANRELRAGAEYRLGAFSLRGGYASGDGLTYGFGISGFNFAFGSNIPASLSTAFKF